MGIFSFLKKKPADTSTFMMEDDFCQVEIIPSSNFDFVTKQAIMVYEFSQAHFDGTGFTDIIARENNPFKISQLLIPITDIEDFLAENFFTRIKKIHYSGGGIIDYHKGVTRAYGDNDFSIWTEVKDDIIINLWVTCRGARTKEQKLQITNILNALGEQYQLIMADWNICEVIDLRQTDQIATYLENYC